MTTMKAVCIRSFGGPEVLELTDIEMPRPADEEVLIRVRAASVNPVDYKIRSGSYPIVGEEQLPKVLGRDVAGEIARCGRAVRDFKEGDTVYAMLDGGLKDAREAQVQLEHGHPRGKVVLELG